MFWTWKSLNFLAPNYSTLGLNPPKKSKRQNSGSQICDAVMCTKGSLTYLWGGSLVYLVRASLSSLRRWFAIGKVVGDGRHSAGRVLLAPPAHAVHAAQGYIKLPLRRVADTLLRHGNKEPGRLQLHLHFSGLPGNPGLFFAARSLITLVQDHLSTVWGN